MNKLSRVITVVALATLGTAAFAQEATYEYPQPATSTITRAQVQADLAEAKRTGFMNRWSRNYDHLAAAQSLKSRADVRAEVLATDRAELAALSGEDSGSFALSRKVAPHAGNLLAAR